MIELLDVTIRSGTFLLGELHLRVPAGQYAVLMGQTGEGKTTILEAICGLRTISKGHIRIHGVDMTRWKPADRGIGYVPQDLALFPTMSVREHLEFALRIRRAPKNLIRERVAELSHVLGIESLLARSVTHLSGGEAQRVALGRALAFEPQVLLLDEPLAALDETTRARLCELLRRVQRSSGLTTLHITHNRLEAVAVADQFFEIKNRRVTEQPLSALKLTDSAEGNQVQGSASDHSPTGAVLQRTQS